MEELKIGSLNCRGLFSDPIKRRDIFLKCREMYDISILVDTHSTKEVEDIWQSEWGFTAVFSSGTSISRGVAVLFKNSFSFEIVQTILDPQGNYIILDIKAKTQQFTLCALYGPNEDSPKFF